VSEKRADDIDVASGEVGPVGRVGRSSRVMRLDAAACCSIIMQAAYVELAALSTGF
jgi:hypothetical protein